MAKNDANSQKTDGASKIDLGKETELDWECAARFNKIIWSKWPSPIKTMFGLADWLRKKGYVVRWRMPMASDGMNTTKWLMDLMIGEKETIISLPARKVNSRWIASSNIWDMMQSPRFWMQTLLE